MTHDTASVPARDAMVAPEPPAPTEPVYGVRIGPGDPAYLTPRGEPCMARADVVLGVESVVEYARSHIDGNALACSIETDRDSLLKEVGDRHLFGLPHPYDWIPERIADHLIDNEASRTLAAIVFERLTYERETATQSTLEELSKLGDSRSKDGTRFPDVSILVGRKGRS